MADGNVIPASLTDVYYSGTETQWNAIDFASSNATLAYATIHFADTTVRIAGDLDSDSQITTSDAFLTLSAYSRTAAGASSSGLTTMQKTRADVDGDGSITTRDAFYILQYYSLQAAGGSPKWSTIIV